MAFTFKPGPPKQARSISFWALRNSSVKITAAKSVGNGIVKLFAEGDENYYVEDSIALRAHLDTKFNITEV